LAIVGSGEYLPQMSEVDRRLIELFDTPPRVVCLPTAAGREGDAMIDEWARRGVEHFTGLGVEAESVRVWDRASANDPGLAERIADADFVYLSGGNPGYLHRTLDATSAWDAILEVVGRGGLFAGCSAGAMIQGEAFAGFPRPHDGFGLWPGVHIIPHFDEIPSPIVSAMRVAVGRKRTLVGVNGNTALVNDNGAYHVLGDEVTVWTSTHKTRYGAGELPPNAFVG
jgi:cyanophycinase-like exopeptidase